MGTSGVNVSGDPNIKALEDVNKAENDEIFLKKQKLDSMRALLIRATVDNARSWLLGYVTHDSNTVGKGYIIGGSFLLCFTIHGRCIF